MTPSATSVVRSGLYTAGGSLGVKIAQFVRAIVVARLLVPSEVGRFGLVVVAISALETATQPGLEHAMVQAGGIGPSGVRTVWTIRVVRGLALFALVFAVAPSVASLLHAPDTAGLIRIVAAANLLRPFGSLAPMLRLRNVDLAPMMRLQVAGEVVETIVAVAAVAATRSAWGLAIGRVAAMATEAVGSYLVPGFKPGFGISRSDLLELVRIGRWYFLSGFLIWLSTAGDDLLVGRIGGAHALGFYRVSWRIANVPTTETTQLVGLVAFPALARTHERSPAKAIEAFRRYLLIATGIAAPTALFIAVQSRDIVLGLLGSQWAEASTPMAIIAFAGLLHAVTGTGGPFFRGVGRPHLDTAMQVVRATVLLGSLPPLIHAFGVNGAGLACVASIVATLPLWAIGLARTGAGVSSSLLVVGRRFPAALAAAGVAWLTGRAIEAAALALVLSGIAGALTWLAAARIGDRELIEELRGLLKIAASTFRSPASAGPVDDGLARANGSRLVEMRERDVIES